MTEWTYASTGGEAYPVRPGELWQAGPHRIACGDIEQGDAQQLIMRCGIPSLVYTDPPWNASNAGAFRTKAKQPRSVVFAHFLGHVVNAICVVRRYAFIEMGCHNADLLAKLIRSSGGTVLARWPITYYRRHPAVLFCATWTGQPTPRALDLTGQDDAVTPLLALNAVRRTTVAETVFDPCTGRGLTARTANTLGATFIGLELSQWRMSAALHSLHKAGLTVSTHSNLTSRAA